MSKTALSEQWARIMELNVETSLGHTLRKKERKIKVKWRVTRKRKLKWRIIRKREM
jgi:hypothetical protein